MHDAEARADHCCLVKYTSHQLTRPWDCPYTVAAMTGRSTITAIMTTTMRKHGGRAVVSLTLDTN